MADERPNPGGTIERLRNRKRAAAALSALAVVLAGCGDDTDAEGPSNAYTGPVCALAPGESLGPVDPAIDYNQIAYRFSVGEDQARVDALQAWMICEPGIDPSRYSPNAIFPMNGEDGMCAIFGAKTPGDLPMREGQVYREFNMVCLDGEPYVAGEN